MKKKTPLDCMDEAFKTFKQRNKEYGDNYLNHGKVMQALFPNGVKLETVEDYNRFGILNMMVAKFTRYCQGWPKAHADSIHDLGVYSFMMESVHDLDDEEIPF